jgi:hypothetical protein
MVVANGIRHELHSHGIHSVTIQPEFVTGEVDVDDESVSPLVSSDYPSRPSMDIWLL